MALSLVYADEAGRIYIDDKLIALGRNGPSFSSWTRRFPA